MEDRKRRWILNILFLSISLTGCGQAVPSRTVQTGVELALPTGTVTRTRAAPSSTTRAPTAPPTATRTTTPTAPLESTPSTPTRLPQPYRIDVLDWELVRATSPALCSGCERSILRVEAPRGLPIAVVQVSVDGQAGAASRVETDLVYASPEALECSLSEDSAFCGIIFGQVYARQITLVADYTGGGEHHLEYLITFQDWADYQP